jgi:hypothetical protein
LTERFQLLIELGVDEQPFHFGARLALQALRIVVKRPHHE